MPGKIKQVYIESIIWNYLPTKRNCKHYNKEESYVKCMLRNQMNCFRETGPSKSCNCIPKNFYKTNFEMYPVTTWNVCKTNEEYEKCFFAMDNCYYHKMVSRYHSSEMRGLCLMKWPSKMLQNFPYFIYTKTQCCFFPNECPGLCRHRPGHS